MGALVLWTLESRIQNSSRKLSPTISVFHGRNYPMMEKLNVGLTESQSGNQNLLLNCRIDTTFEKQTLKMDIMAFQFDFSKYDM